MKSVDLTYREDDFIGIIFPMQSGVLWTNQAGGTCCSFQKLEGIYVPLPREHYTFNTTKDPLKDLVSHYQQSLVKAFLDATRLAQFFGPVAPFDGIRLLEAWVPVRLTSSLGEFTDLGLADWNGAWGIITYPNSD